MSNVIFGCYTSLVERWCIIASLWVPTPHACKSFVSPQQWATFSGSSEPSVTTLPPSAALLEWLLVSTDPDEILCRLRLYLATYVLLKPTSILLMAL